ncbi:hypothetical protein [Cellulomonas xiejunii]|uniref:Uncharacterized protein n=1 Tax=Cellulomonas xiejunii TaxID=2968083 RepID=A0ABY5KT71_9CELL|nr:hypothetical protein [Cellulomonas xiejunii]UUI72381.1 hypothetical protein NP048_02615 [Cellulomonas xiejunii]
MVPLGAADTAQVLWVVLAPLVASGAILRRPRLTPLADRVHADDRGVAVLRDLAQRYDRRPVLVHIGPRTMLVPLHVDDGRALLDASPEPFTPASLEKRVRCTTSSPTACSSARRPHGRRAARGTRPRWTPGDRCTARRRSSTRP